MAESTASDGECDTFYDCESDSSPQVASSTSSPLQENKALSADQPTPDCQKLNADSDEHEQDVTTGADSGDNESTSSIQSPIIEDESKAATTEKSDQVKDDEPVLSEEETEELRLEAVKLKNEANTEYKNQCYLKAYDLYSDALKTCPKTCTKERSIVYSNRAASLIAMEKKKEAIEDCNHAIELDPRYVRALLRRAQLQETTEKLDEALEDYKKVLEIDPSVHQARAACTRLPGLINVRNEKLKTEMMGKMKELGNMFLKPFGLSTNNFQVNQNEGGSYNIQFTQNPSSPSEES